MSRSLLTRATVVILVGMMGLTGLVMTWPNAGAATWIQDTDTDFGAGTWNGVEVVGTGAPAVIQILKNSGDWLDESPAAHPGQREGAAMAYDSTNDVVVLFGGYDGTYLGDTWEYVPGTNTWSQTSVTGPSGREMSGIAFDSVNGLVVLFGGVSNAGFENDTWEYNAVTNAWTQRTPNPAPPTLASYHLAFDSAAAVGRTILAGRTVSTAQMVTWAYDAGAHTWANRNPSPGLPETASFAMGYHAGLDAVVVFGGIDPTPPPGTLLRTTFEYSWTANSWTQKSNTGPSARAAAGVSYRASTASLYLFGGNDGATRGDTWRYLDGGGGTRLWLPVIPQRR